MMMWTKTERINTTPPVNNGLNPWTHGKRIQIYVTEWGWDMREVSWKGKTITVEYELFIMLVKDLMKRYNWSKEQVLDELFNDAYDVRT